MASPRRFSPKCDSLGEAEFERFPSIRAIYTATAGLDHIDRAACIRRNVVVRSAPGHNAESVADWVVVALSFLASHSADSAPKTSIGIIGVGHAGTAVARRARAMGLLPVLCDPAGDSGQRLSVRVV